MKKMNSMVMAIALLTMALPMNAQTNRNKQQESLVKKVTTIWNNAKKQVKQTGKISERKSVSMIWLQKSRILT